ncbi:HpcH/HpaI aldolase/citrate lyase family protein [Aspergillus eucalypticola CBS 122712]|uniref:HpcH/HpaI aldolase/citrate lyase family protein n=1 Tax=Aspergillus eucalypticola (strain CBS 122712 / IBT 29274) TaxID=1448314 RepID=A0A317UNU3_ASPEC|nr:HpcH/HpaI aldolase/citrate lyase family protein [Aspergillus eucalypticola CBS 122712]PWY62207.1 HpcH/HpaI aldolase/citrate lyase family protein [Aspergillus eucalypticola CBS 122712]
MVTSIASQGCASLERATARQGPSIGQWLDFPGYSLARTVAPLGQMYWVLIDCEHGDIDDKAMYLQVGASAGMSPIGRIPASEPWMMKCALDCGAHATMVPMCVTKVRQMPEQAEAIVRGCNYPSSQWPQGLRGAGAMFAPAAFNQSGREYLTHANNNVVIIVQIESRMAVENCAAIAAVPGIDMLFVGPNDLASSLGYFALDHAQIPEAQEATNRGFDFFNSGADIVALTSWMLAELTRLGRLTQISAAKPSPQ